jgi:hypothetical protein
MNSFCWLPRHEGQYTNDFQASLMAFVLSGLFVVLAETVFEPERNRAAKMPARRARIGTCSSSCLRLKSAPDHYIG